MTASLAKATFLDNAGYQGEVMRLTIFLIVVTATIFPMSGHSEESIRVPISGNYSGRATLITSQTGGLALFPSAGSQEAIGVIVSECGDKITVRHPQLPNGIETEFVEESWRGSANYQGQATISLRVFSENETSFKAIYHLSIPAIDHTQDWTLEMTTPVQPTVPAGAGEIKEYQSRPGERQGLWNTALTDYGMVIYDFQVNSSDLLFRHKQVLDETAKIMTNPDWVPEQGAVCPLEPKIVASTAVLGFASDTGPESYNRTLANNRANRAATYLRNAVAEQLVEGADSFPWLSQIGTPNSGAATVGEGGNVAVNGDGDLLRPNPSLTNVESSCNRSVQFFFVQKQARLEMYTRAKAKEWLRADLLETAEKHIEAETELNPDLQNVLRAEVIIARRNARAAYALAVQYLDLVNGGNCEPPGQRNPNKPSQDFPPCSAATGANGVHPGCLALNSDTDAKRGIRAALEKAMRIDGSYTEGDLISAMQNDPWLEATYQRHSESTTQEADEVECGIFGTRMQSSELQQGWFWFDDGAWQNPQADC